MPKGVTQDQVNAAIDALVAAGERPTIERVRVKLGTGSPNTLTRMLDAWWAQLHERLTRQQAKLAVPNAPEDVAVAATRLWQLALERAGAQVEQGTAAQREALARDQAALATSTHAWEHQLREASATAAAAVRDRDVADGRLRDLQRLLDQQDIQLSDHQARLSQALAQVEDLSGRLQASQQALLGARSEAAAERSSLEASHRAAEDRWMQEVDKARQDEAKTAARLQHVESAGKAISEKASSELAQHLAQLRKAEQDLARKDARIVALEEQFERLHRQLGSALASAASERVASTATVRKKRQKTLQSSKPMVLPSYSPAPTSGSVKPAVRRSKRRSTNLR